MVTSKKILLHFQKVDPVMYTAMREIGPLEEIKPREPREYFSSLCSEIISQQLSSKAAVPIHQRFLSLFPRKKVSTKHLLSIPDEKVRGVGTSWAKVSFLKDLAEKTINKEVPFSKLPNLDDEAVIEELIKVKGIGRWTAEMFLIFSLGRPDVFSHGDLGLRRAIEKLYKLTDPNQEKIEKITGKWSPYRSWGSRTLWKFID